MCKLQFKDDLPGAFYSKSTDPLRPNETTLCCDCLILFPLLFSSRKPFKPRLHHLNWLLTRSHPRHIMWFTVCDVLYSSCFTLMQALLCVCRRAHTEERRGGEWPLMALSRAYLINRLINNPGLSHLRREELSSLWWEVMGEAADGMVRLAFSYRTLWTSQDDFFLSKRGMWKWRDSLRSGEEKIRQGWRRDS